LGQHVPLGNLCCTVDPVLTTSNAAMRHLLKKTRGKKFSADPITIYSIDILQIYILRYFYISQVILFAALQKQLTFQWVVYLVLFWLCQKIMHP
jgi:hypothetical protein